MTTLKEHLRKMLTRASRHIALQRALQEGQEAARAIRLGSPYLGAFEAATAAGYGRDAELMGTFMNGYFDAVPYVFTDEAGVVIKLEPRNSP